MGLAEPARKPFTALRRGFVEVDEHKDGLLTRIRVVRDEDVVVRAKLARHIELAPPSRRQPRGIERLITSATRYGVPGLSLVEQLTRTKAANAPSTERRHISRV